MNNLDTAITDCENILNQWKNEEQIRQSNLIEYNKYTHLYDTCITDLNTLKSVLYKLETFYINHKKSLSKELCNELSDIINTIFNNHYEFDFSIEYKRQKKHTTLVDNIRGGSAKIVCGGAVKQTITFLSTLSILRQKLSDFCWLDESFSNFGSEEIKKIPDILALINDIQIMFTEHKTEFIPDDKTNILEFSRNKGESSKVKFLTPHLLEETKQFIENKEVTEQDLEILKSFNITSDIL